MGTFHSFEDIMAWKRGHEVVIQLYRITNHPDSGLRKDYGLRDQMRRCAVSITSNIAEGFGRKGDKEFCFFLNVSKGSCFELRSQLIIARDLGYVEEDVFQWLNNELIEIGKMLTGLMSYLTKKSKVE